MTKVVSSPGGEEQPLLVLFNICIKNEIIFSTECSHASTIFFFDKRVLLGRAKLNQQQVCPNVSAHFLDKQALQGSFFASLTQLLYTGGLPLLFGN